MFSVIVATYNGSNFIIEQLNSLINQTVKLDRIYIYDDCSSDDTLIKIQSWIHKNDVSNVILRKNESNKGYTKNFLDALCEVEGDFVFLCDQDDVWESDKVFEFSKVTEQYKNFEQPFLLTSGYAICDENLNEIKSCHVQKGENTRINEVMLNSFIKDCSYPGMTFCVNRRLIEEAKTKRNYEFIKFHDYFLSVLALINGKMLCIQKKLVLYRQHGSNQIGAAGSASKTRKHWKKVLAQKQDEIRILEYCGLEKTFIKKKSCFLKKRIDWFLNKKMLSIILNFPSYLKYFDFKSFLGDLYFSMKKDAI